MDKLLSDNFQLKGEWWLPGHEAKSIPGVVSYTPDRIELEVHGVLSPKKAEASPIAALKSILESELTDEIPVVHGTTSKGPFTLLNVLASSIENSLSHGVKSSRYSSSLLIHDCHLSSLTEPCLELRFGSTLHDYFFDGHPFDVKRVEGDNGPSGMLINYTGRKDRHMKASETEELILAFNAHVSESRREVTLHDLQFFKFLPKTPQPLERLLARMWQVCHLFTLLTEDPVVPTYCDALLDWEGESRFSRVYYTAAKRFRYEGKSKSALPLFRFNRIEDLFEHALELWMAADGSLQNSIQLFLEGRENHFPSIEGQFIVLTQAIEALSRAVMVSEYMNDDEYKKVASKIIAAIPSTLDSGHRESLKNKIKYGNEHSLRKRIMGLLAALGEEAQKLVCQSLSSFTSGIVETRNYLTHYTDELRPKAFNGTGMHWAGVRMAMLLRIHFLKYLGLDESLICDSIRHNWRLAQNVKRARENPESVVTESGLVSEDRKWQP